MVRMLWNGDAEEKLTVVLETEDSLDIAEMAIRTGYPYHTIVKHMRRIAKNLNIKIKGSHGIFSIDRSIAESLLRVKPQRFVCRCIGPGGDTISLTMESLNKESAMLKVLESYVGVKVIEVLTKKEHLEKYKIKTKASIRRRVTNEKYIY